MAGLARLDACSSAIITEEQQSAPCRFCGFVDAIAACLLRPGPDDTGSICCRLCAGVQALGRATIDHEAILIWAPFLSQAALNRMVRGLQVTMVAGGGGPRPDEPLAPALGDHAQAAWTLYRKLLACRHPIIRRLGSTKPSVLVQGLASLPGGVLASRVGRPSGIRVLHLGRHFRAGADIYPDIVRAWAAARGQQS